MRYFTGTGSAHAGSIAGRGVERAGVGGELAGQAASYSREGRGPERGQQQRWGRASVAGGTAKCSSGLLRFISSVTGTGTARNVVYNIKCCEKYTVYVRNTSDAFNVQNVDHINSPR